MGSLREYSCPDCGYTAKVSGGKDRGFIAFTETVECLDCWAADSSALPQSPLRSKADT